MAALCRFLEVALAGFGQGFGGNYFGLQVKLHLPSRRSPLVSPKRLSFIL